jgi:hypothetical protein
MKVVTVGGICLLSYGFKEKVFKMLDSKQNMFKLRHANVIRQAVLYRKQHEMDTTLLRDVVEAMLHDSAWEITKQLHRDISVRKKTRYMTSMQNIFEFRIGHSPELNNSWLNQKLK